MILGCGLTQILIIPSSLLALGNLAENRLEIIEAYSEVCLVQEHTEVFV